MAARAATATTAMATARAATATATVAAARRRLLDQRRQHRRHLGLRRPLPARARLPPSPRLAAASLPASASCVRAPPRNFVENPPITQSSEVISTIRVTPCEFLPCSPPSCCSARRSRTRTIQLRRRARSLQPRIHPVRSRSLRRSGARVRGGVRGQEQRGASVQLRTGVSGGRQLPESAGRVPRLLAQVDRRHPSCRGGGPRP